MIATEPIYIPINKRKLTGLLRLSIKNLIVGLALTSMVFFRHSLLPILFSSVGIMLTLFAAPWTFSLFQKWKDKKAGITVDQTGITDNTILFCAGHIPWSDILEIKRTKDKILVIMVTNPLAYIRRQSSFVKRRILKSLFKTYGSPIVIPYNELRSDFDELQNILQAELKENKLG